MQSSNQIFLSGCFVVLLPCLVGCVPAPLGKYYKPLYPDATASYSGEHCGGKAGAPASLTFTLTDGVQFNVRAWREYAEQRRKDRPLRITITLPKAVEVRFLSDEILIGTDASNIVRRVTPAMDILARVVVASDETVDLARIAPTRISSQAPGSGVTNFSASTALHFSWKDDFVPSSLSMELPPIHMVDTPITDLPPLKILAEAKPRPETYPGQYKSTSSLIYVTEASNQALAEKYSRCVRETPERKCQQILWYDEGGFKLERAGFRFSGRWYVHDVEKHSPFSGTVNVHYDKPMTWRFATNTIHVTDRLTQARRSYQFNAFPLYLGYTVPLDTSVRGVNDAPDGKETSLSMTVSLGDEELPRYFIQMPPLSINGKTYRFKPIELERRLLDFGLEPFNC